VQEGGYTEQLAAARIGGRRQQQHQCPLGHRRRPRLPALRQAMALRTARKGARVGSQFYFRLPQCKGGVSSKDPTVSDRSAAQPRVTRDPIGQKKRKPNSG